MTRQTKTKEERRLEIIQTAEKLFSENGYNNTSVEAIIKEMGVAKGTYYYYFKSKEDVLEAIVEHQLDEVVKMAEELANTPDLPALTKMELLLSDSHVGTEDNEDIIEHLHLPANRELHEVTNIQTILRLSPIMAKIIEQGNEEGVFNVERPLPTIRLLLTGAQFLMDGGLFEFSEQETEESRIVLQEIIEKVLGAERGSFSFMNPPQQMNKESKK